MSGDLSILQFRLKRNKERWVTMHIEYQKIVSSLEEILLRIDNEPEFSKLAEKVRRLLQDAKRMDRRSNYDSTC